MLADIDGNLYEALPYALVGLGVVLTYRYLKLIDLTFAASFVAGPAIGGALLIWGVPFWLAMLAALAIVIALAATTLILTWLLEIDGLLAGLLSSFGGIAVALLFTQGTLSLHSITTPFDELKAIDYPWADGVTPLHPSQIAAFLVLVIAAKVVVDRFLASELGLAFRAMEDDRSRTFLLASIGISEWRMLGIGVVLGNILCGMAGTLVMLKEGQVTANRGFDALIAVIAAYLLGHVLFERRPARGRPGRVARFVGRIAVFRPTTAAILGLLFYFLLLGIVSRTDLPSSLPRLAMLALIVASFLATRWSEIMARLTVSRADRSYLVPANAAFEASGVTVEYPGYPSSTIVIHDATLAIPAHSVVQIQGANGSGKSTILRYLSGLSAGRGTVSIPANAASSQRMITDRKPFIGYISQDAQLASSATLSVLENLALFRAGARASVLRRWQNPVDEGMSPSIASLADRAGNTLAGHLSGGQRQLLNMAGVIVRHEPPGVVLFDEPLTHLDEPTASACVDLMKAMSDEGRTLLIVQHDLGLDNNPQSSEARCKLARLVTQVIDLESIQGPPQRSDR